ncbi:MAG TPA: presqualene diphosphate synthase HpnD [Micropepsaceae bacterium]|nr:presqualene diphosphate synthase HpnD [Micropepsaceae bacterium]
MTLLDGDWESARSRISGSSFYVAMRLMPKDRREAMFSIYAFNRAVDDIADEGDANPAERLRRLDLWRDAIDLIYSGGPSPASLVEVVAKYGLRREDFLSVIEGMAMDATGASLAPDFATLDYYCDCVASAVGRLSIKIFGMDEEPGFQLAHHLGRALQFTNILRDLSEDAALDRLYLPRELLHDAGIHEQDPARVLSHPGIDVACRSLAQIAHRHYQEADLVLKSATRGSAQPPRLMSAVYRGLLKKMERTGWHPPQRRIRVGRAPLLLIALRYGLSW